MGSTGGFSYSGANGKFYVPDGDVWRETLSPDANGEGNIFGDLPSANAYRVTPALPNVGGGTLYAYVYGKTQWFLDAAFSRVEAELVETSTGDSVETLLTVFERDDNIASATVTLPLVTEWEYRINPGFDQFQEMTAFQSLITGETYFDFSQCVAKERHSVHTRLRYIDATIDGIYSPEFRFTFEASDETSFDTDIVASLVFARLDPKTGQTSGVFLEILET
ncbi:hypothetical protein IIC65_01925 [Candidatus Sumerlaeota bacterium]|nr:hypothetical protein [Candidatus Sumerlaeota bacterium]